MRQGKKETSGVFRVAVDNADAGGWQRGSEAGNMNGFIYSIEAWAAKCVDDPRWVAECLNRIGRFGGQHPTSTVLMHSLDVWWMCRYESPETQLWSQFHDAHEIITGDVTRIAKSLAMPLRKRQQHMDWVLLVRLCGIIPSMSQSTKIMSVVHEHDQTCGDRENHFWNDMVWMHGIDKSAAVDAFEFKVRSLMAAVAATKG